MALINRPDHAAATWQFIGTTGRIRVGTYPDGTARLSVRPTGDFGKRLPGHPWRSLLDGTLEECLAAAAILEPVFEHAHAWCEARRKELQSNG
jgi:hypothetical protein